MTIHESGINFHNLIRDLAEMYPFEVSDVIFTEIIANALDAKATKIAIDFNSRTKTLVVTDNGKGMSESEFDQYHDFAAGLKTRGTGIGFAGVGAKVSFNLASKVITETRSSSFSGGSNWYLQSDKRLIWEDINPEHLIGNGTRVEIIFDQASALPYSSAKDFYNLLIRHYAPLLLREFLELYESLGFYSKELRFMINGQVLEPFDIEDKFNLEKIHRFKPTKAGKRYGYGLFALSSIEYPIEPTLCGILLCVHGKVIKSELFNQFPGEFGPRILGFVEIPGLINFLTTSKTDFIKRKKLKEFEQLYDPVRQEFKQWVGELGIQSFEDKRSEIGVRLERELKKLLDDIPELSNFFGFRTRKSVLALDDGGQVIAEEHEGTEQTFPIGQGVAGEGPGITDIGMEPGIAIQEGTIESSKRAKPISRKGKRGPKVALESRPDRIDLAWVEGNDIVINQGSPSFIKVEANNEAIKVYCMFAIANAVFRFLSTEGEYNNPLFVDGMMCSWGKK